VLCGQPDADAVFSARVNVGFSEIVTDELFDEALQMLLDVLSESVPHAKENVWIISSASLIRPRPEAAALHYAVVWLYAAMEYCTRESFRSSFAHTIELEEVVEL
jgi:hypothetical protein